MRQIWLVSAPALLDQLFFPISFHFFSHLFFTSLCPRTSAPSLWEQLFLNICSFFIFSVQFLTFFNCLSIPFSSLWSSFLKCIFITLHINSSHHYAADRVRPHFESNYTTAANHSNKPLQVPPNWIKTNIESNIRCQSKNWISNISKIIGNYIPPSQKKSAK